ncbi:endonuclease NucS domain-containing protein [Paludibaculum fermentans]|uniref:endonuclease NucS domain-containing protein n=1 Tax=Paludibaculum fermentans TaxID=1473598 RepID=UPI003EBE2C5D
MAIYDKPTRELMRQMVAEMPLSAGQVISRDAILNWFAARFPKINEGTIGAHLVRLSTNARSRIHHNPKPGTDDMFFQVDSRHFRLYDPATDPPPILRGALSLGTNTLPDPPLVDESDEPSTEAFAYESDLRDFLSRNLHILESGLRLYEDEGITGVEFPAGGRFIDILALDSKRRYVVVELKVSRGYDRTVGQLRRYMGWIAKNHAESGRGVRGMIVAREISQDLVLACAGLSDVELFEYKMSVSVSRIES